MSGTVPIFQLDDESQPVQDAPAPTRSCLVRIYPASASGSLLELHGPRMTLGRDPLCDVELNDDFASRVHAILERVGDDWCLSDRGSLNGTIVNDNRIDQQKLSSGDQIHIGNHIFKFLSSDHVEAQYHEAVYEMMTLDALTETFNRRYFEDILRREMLRAVRYSRPLALLMLDIDFFKHVNDRYGHLVGDEVLRALGGRLRSRARDDEVLARVGGEEFALALPEISLENAMTVADELRELVCEAPMETSRGPVKVTISVGVAHSDGNSPLSSSELMKRADEKLYEAKRGGRNCVRF
jgi:diguanylate cyclase (GGDEF)-like protein